MSYKDTDQASDEGTGNTTTAFRVDSLGDASAAAAEAGVGGVEELSNGSAPLVVKRGPNAGTGFLLDQPLTSAGRHPGSDIFLDDVTVGRRHAEFRKETADSTSSTPTASTAPMSTVNQCSRRYWPAATRSISASSVCVPDQAHNRLTDHDRLFRCPGPFIGRP